jgi:transposase
MGRTKEQKAAADAALVRARAKREAREQAARNQPRIRTIDQVENALLILAWQVSVQGKDAVPEFENAERILAAMKRAEALLEEHGVKQIADLEPFFKAAEPLTQEQADKRGKRRWGE